MTPEDVYHAWADPEATWSRWAKPVLFAHLSEPRIVAMSTTASEPLQPFDLSWTPPADGSTAIVVDLPGAASVGMGLSLANAGYRPVPLYNAVPAPSGGAGSAPLSQVAVDMLPVLQHLVRDSAALAERNLPANAPPAFLLDSRRRGPILSVRPGDFDNRSVSLPTDFPSANFLLAAGVRQVFLVLEGTATASADLSHTLRRWQDAGIPIHCWVTGSAAAGPVTIAKPARFRHLWYGLLARMGLRRNPLGGYGGFLPIPSAG